MTDKTKKPTEELAKIAKMLFSKAYEDLKAGKYDSFIIPEEPAEEIQVSDVVTLKSGGPRMTVLHIITHEKSARCVWFNGTEQSRDHFPIAMLKKIDV